MVGAGGTLSHGRSPVVLFLAGIADDERNNSVALSEIDRSLLERCLHKKPRAWEDFVDRFMGLIVHVVNHTAQARSVRLTPEDRDDFCAEVFLNLIRDDFAILRRFRGQSSLATYLTVVARRIVVHQILGRKQASPLSVEIVHPASQISPHAEPPPEQRIDNQEEVERLLQLLEGTEAQVVRMYHLEGKSYQEIGAEVGLAENSIGPILSRARAKLRQFSVEAGKR